MNKTLEFLDVGGSSPPNLSRDRIRESISKIFADQLHMYPVFLHVPFNDAPHVADTLG